MSDYWNNEIAFKPVIDLFSNPIYNINNYDTPATHFQFPNCYDSTQTTNITTPATHFQFPNCYDCTQTTNITTPATNFQFPNCYDCTQTTNITTPATNSQFPNFYDSRSAYHSSSSDQEKFVAIDKQQQIGTLISTEFEIIKNRRDTIFLLYEGCKFYTHNRNKPARRDNIHWRCVVKECKRRIHTNDTKIVNKIGEHNMELHKESETKATIKPKRIHMHANKQRTVNEQETNKKKQNRNHSKNPNEKISNVLNNLHNHSLQNVILSEIKERDNEANFPAQLSNYNSNELDVYLL